MKFNITFRKTSSTDDVIDYIHRRLSFAFARMEHVIDSGSITISDINGPKGGVDKQCRVVIKPTGMKRIVISEKQPDLRLAVDRSISRASHSLSRQLKRKQHLTQRRVSTDEAAERLNMTTDMEASAQS